MEKQEAEIRALIEDQRLLDVPSYLRAILTVMNAIYQQNKQPATEPAQVAKPTKKG